METSNLPKVTVIKWQRQDSKSVLIPTLLYTWAHPAYAEGGGNQGQWKVFGMIPSTQGWHTTEREPRQPEQT